VAQTPLVLLLGTTTTPVAMATSTADVASETAVPIAAVGQADAADVGQAYENFWHVRSEAEFTLDASRASEVMDGAYLQNFLDVMSQLQQEHHAIKTQVVLNYTVVEVADGTAYVHDRIEDSSYYIDPTNGSPLTDPANDLSQIEFKLNNVNGTWKVVDSVTHD
jgi:hypothetical protein